jgi:periplasmic divalent cation tolerance protein
MATTARREAETGVIVVSTTAASEDEAERITRALLKAGCAACVQHAPVTSRYLWKGELVRSAEVLLLIKSRAELFDRIASVIRDMHSYETPEIIATAVVAGSPDYLAWIDDNTGAP